nr:MAG TPA: hypothetical protein [Caudoviricetes sp.]
MMGKSIIIPFGSQSSEVWQMIDYKHEDLFRDGTDKQLSIVSVDGKVNITNSEIYYEQFELKESLCSQSELIFGACEASQIKFKISNVFTSMVGMHLAVTTTLEGQKDAPFSLGKYRVVSDKPTADRRYRNVTAYDAMYDILNAEVSGWYKGLTFPMTLRQFRDSFCTYVGVEQEEITLINDDMTIEKTIDPGELPGKTVIEAICEINGCFGHIGRNGKLRYVVLVQMIEGLYPADDLYPSDDLYPADPLGTTEVSKSNYISCQYEDFICQHIDKLQIRQEENDIGAISGTGNNCYIIEDNFLVYGKSAADLQTIADNVLSVIGVVWYRPAQVEARGNPCLEVGDGILLYTTRETIYTYILQRTLKGIQALRDSYTAEGEEYRTGQVNGLQKQIIQLKGKSNVLTRTVEETRLELRDVDQNLSAQISINAQQILTKVSKDNIVSEINQTAESIKIKAERIDLVGIVNAEEMRIKYATIETLNVTKLELNNLIATKATVDSLNAVSGRVGSLEADHVTVSDLNGVSARLGTVESNYISAGTVKANYMEVANWTSAGEIKADKISAATIVNKLSSVDLVSVRALGVSGYMNYKGVVVAWRTQRISSTVVIQYLGPEE